MVGVVEVDAAGIVKTKDRTIDIEPASTELVDVPSMILGLLMRRR